MSCLQATVLLALSFLATSPVAPRHAPPPPPAPRMIVPAHPDTVDLESAPAPLLVPGQPSSDVQPRKSPEQFAREQVELGAALERIGHVGAAVLAYENAVRADSTFPGASEKAGRLSMQVGQLAAAEQLFRLELRHHPANDDASRQLALVLSARGRHVEAVTRARRLTSRDPRRDDNWYALGIVSANAGHKREAETALRRALALGPERSLEHRDLGVLLASEQRTAEARQEYRKALALGDREPAIWIDLGNLEARAGHPDTALADYREAERRDSSYALAYEAQIKIHERLSRPDDVADVYLRWVTALPNDDDLRLRAVRHLAAIGRRDRALEIGRDGVRHDPRSPSAHLILGLALASYGDTRESVAELRRAETLFGTPRDRKRVRQLVASMRATAPDSLRAMFAADSVAHAAPAQP